MGATKLELDGALLERVRAPVREHTTRTPVVRSDWLSSLTGGEVWLKCENLQVTGSFKARGGVAAIATLSDEERAGGVVTCSTGNHAQALARAASLFDVPCTIVISALTPAVKEERTKAWGARVVRAPGGAYDEAFAWMNEHLGELGGTFVSPFEHPAVMAGNGGTTGLELLDDVPGSLDAIVAPCGGGGLVSGLGLAAREHGGGTRVVGVCAAGSPAMWLSRRDGRAYTELPLKEGEGTIADGLEGGTGELAYRLVNELVDDVLVAQEGTIERALVELCVREKLVVEGSGATAVAALLEGAFAGERVCVILSGGNVPPALLGELLASYAPDR